MKLILSIETNDPAELARVADALRGVQPVAEKPAVRQVKEQSASKTEASPPVAQNTAPVPATATTTDVVPTEADLTAAANAAAAKVGAGGPGKLKEYIARTYQKADGTPGTLKLTRDDQKAKLLADLKAVADGTLSV